MLFVETSLFTAQLARYLSDDGYRELQTHRMAHPDAGAIIRGSGGIGKEILAGLDEIAAWKRGELKLKTTKAALPKAADGPAVRARLGLSQAAFATCMGGRVGTLRKWEQGRREPPGPAPAPP